MKGVGMFVVSLRGVNFGFWSQDVLGKMPSYLAVKVSFRVPREKNFKKYIVCVLTWSLLGVNKSLSHAQIGLLGFNSKFPMRHPHPFHMRSPLPGILGLQLSTLVPVSQTSSKFDEC